MFVDIEERTYTMDPGLLEGAITPRTRAIVPVHLFGQTADMDPILEISAAASPAGGGRRLPGPRRPLQS